MIDWIEVGNRSFYADTSHSLIGAFYVDKSKSLPRLWRLRLTRNIDDHCIVVRIKRPEAYRRPLNRATEMTHGQLRGLMADIKAAAVAFGLEPQGQQRKLNINAMFRTDMSGMEVKPEVAQ